MLPRIPHTTHMPPPQPAVPAAANPAASAPPPPAARPAVAPAPAAATQPKDDVEACFLSILASKNPPGSDVTATEMCKLLSYMASGRRLLKGFVCLTASHVLRHWPYIISNLNERGRLRLGAAVGIVGMDEVHNVAVH